MDCASLILLWTMNNWLEPHMCKTIKSRVSTPSASSECFSKLEKGLCKVFDKD